jgi:NADH:ubiquinone oxidoreductase subunit 5 (subunit L)/multisubunit Na+/H+ antiporter MnhA subunit
MGGLFVCITFTSSILMVSNFTVCGMPFLAEFYSKNFILDIFSTRYVSMFCFILADA